MQKRSFDYHAPEDTALLNSRFQGVIPIGVHQGFQVINGDPGFVSILPGVLTTADGVRIEETDTQANLLAIPPADPALERQDYIICRHKYIRTVPPAPALFEIVTGNPSATPYLPSVPGDSVILASATLAAAADTYTNIQLAGPQNYHNAVFDGSEYRIVHGNEAAWWWNHDRSQDQIRLFLIAAGTYSDGAVIDWGTPKATFSAAGLEELNTAATALQAALANAKGRPWDESVPSNQNLSGIHSRVESLETPEGLPSHASKHAASGADPIEFDALADGTSFKKMSAAEQQKLSNIESGAEVNNISDQDATDLTDGGNCSVHKHDDLYYPSGGTVANSDKVDGKHASAFATSGHKHDSRYMREVFTDSRIYSVGETANFTFSEAPDLITSVYNYLDNGLPQATSYARGSRTSEISIYVTKLSNNNNKTYKVTVSNGSSYELYISVGVWRRD